MESQNIDHCLIKMEQVLLRQQEPIVILKLAAYAADALRVLLLFERHADMSQAFDDTLKSACPDWRNPGAVVQPVDLIAMALVHAIATLKKGIHSMEQAVEATRHITSQ
jgi:hypothetical protein